MAFPQGWLRKVAITIDRDLCGSADSDDFTVLLTRANLPSEMCSPTSENQAQLDGGDLRFSADASGSTQLALHVERFAHDTTDSAGDADVALNVRVPVVNGSESAEDTVIYCWYSSSTAVSQPEPGDPCGSKNAYDENHVHVWSLDESPSDTEPQYKDVVGGRHLTAQFGTATREAGKNGGYAFDGNASAIGYGRHSGFPSPNNADNVPCTNTGLCYIPSDDTLAVANFDDTEIIEVNKTTGAVIARIALTEGETSIQGLAYDSVADQFIVCPFSSSAKYFYDRATGAFDRMLNFGADRLCYDPNTDCYWTGGNGSAERYNKSGVLQETVNFTGDAANITTADGIGYDPTNHRLFITADVAFAVFVVDASDGSTITSFRGPLDIEHPAYDTADNILWVNGDSKYHSGGVGGKNVIYRLSPTGGPYDWRGLDTQYTVEYWLRPDSVAGTTVVSAFWSAVTTGAFAHEIQCRAGAIRAYTPNAEFTQAGTFTNATWQHIWADYDQVAAALRVFKDNSSAINDTSAAGVLRPDGDLAIGGRQDGTLKFNGRFDSFRIHNVVRSDSWRTARYNNTNTPSTFAAAGTPEDGVLPPVYVGSQPVQKIYVGSQEVQRVYLGSQLIYEKQS